MSPQLALAVVGVLIIANGMFVAAEFALVASRRGMIEEQAAEGVRGAAAALAELRQLSFVLSAAQFGITATSLLVGFLAEDAVGDTIVRPVVDRIGLPDGTTTVVSVAAAFLLSTVVQMIFGELAPKNIAIAEPERTARRVTPITRWFGIVAGPVIRVFDGAAAALTRRVFRVEVKEELHGGLDLDELARVIDASREDGALADVQADLLERATRLGDQRVASVMVPRPDIVWLDADDDLEALRRASATSGHSRFPVREGDDEVVGTVHVKDLLAADSPDATLRSIAAPPLVVPESERLRSLLTTMRRGQRTFAVVVDEYGTPSGVVTIEDVVEQLVGDIEDEFDGPDEPRVRRLGRGRFRVQGTVRTSRFRSMTGVTLPDGDYETVAGFVIDRLGHLPEVGESVDVDDVRLTVTEVDGVRVVELEVVRS